MSFVEVVDLAKTFRRRGGAPVRAVDGVSFTIEEGDCLGVIGESGSGKSTLARLVLRLIDADAGLVRIGTDDVLGIDRRRLRRSRSRWQIVFQEPFASLNPRMSIQQIVTEPLVLHAPGLSAAQRRDKAAAMLEEVGLATEFLSRRPAHLSGGQQQRVGIARALITDPSFVVLDEPTASLDMTIRASVLATLARLRRDRGLTYLLISHDLGSVEAMCTQVAVMQHGVFVEQGLTGQVVNNPVHPYSQSLLSARLTVDGAFAGRAGSEVVA